MMLRVLLFLALPLVPVASHAQSADLVALATQTLRDLQAQSFDRNREYCGMIGRDADGALVVSEPRRGWRSSCRPKDPRGAVELVASYHTHGAWNPKFHSEIPSTDDVYSDMEEEVFGFVATPGGRLWMIDWRDGTARQICAQGCVPADDAYPQGGGDDIAQSYTLPELIEIFEE